MTDDIEVRVSFPQYAAKMERIDSDNATTMVIRCPLCGSETTRRKFDLPVEYADLVRARASDRDAYWQHLVTQHPDRFDAGS